ncbi:Serine active site containing protein 1 [Phytophthora pseudosyringae]|uniref:Serine active site containing protein 1 n=1 Tax=Phytophthora pseudosyringae TaxID=221518 RepID=A0A8T1VUK6_9STRA|nr:Serine active site containing protein 1 [Phytophthora pseudosyringae]
MRMLQINTRFMHWLLIYFHDHHSDISAHPRAMPPQAKWTRRFLSRGKAAADPRLSARKRSRSLPPLSVAVGAGAAALALTSSPDSARRMRNMAHMGVLVYHESEVAGSFEDATALVTQWAETLRRGGFEAAQDELVERLLSCILRLEDDRQSQDTLRFLVEHGALPLLVQYTAWSRPTEPRRLQQLVESIIKLLKVSAANGQVELWLSLVTLAQALAHLMEQEDDVVSYVDLLQLGDALTKVQQLAHQRLEEGADASRAFVVNRSDLADPDYSRVAESCAALVKMCSPEMPDSMKKFGLWALAALVQAVNRGEASAFHAQQLEAALGPAFATLLLAFPRTCDGMDLQLRAAAVVDRLLHVARQNPAAVTRETYELWMDQVRYWTGTEQPEEEPQPNKRNWLRRKSGQIDQLEEEEAMKHRQKQHLQLQLASSRCLRTLTASPQSRRYVCESPTTRAALFELSRRVHEKKLHIGNVVDGDAARCLMGIQRHMSWTFRNICTGFQSGAMALNCLFDASWTSSLLQSRRHLPMSRFFRGINDLTDLPIIGAEEYESTIEFGWVDILTAWSASTDRKVRENAIASLIYLAEQHQPSPARLMSEQEEEISNKQEHILQAWLTNMLQQIRLLSGGELLAVKQMEEIAHVSKELTPGNERILFNPAVVDAGTSALAVLAEHHHAELVQQGVVPLVALLSATRAATPAQHTQCARVLANLVATFCLDIDPRSSALSTDFARTVVSSDHVDIARLLEQTASGKQFLGDIRRWRECNDPMQRSNYFRVVQNLRAYDEVVAAGRLVEDVYCEGVHPIVSQSDTDSLNNSTDNDSSAPLVDVVFVHGLRGHPFGTWRTDMSNKLKGNNDVWPDVLLAKDLQRNKVPARLVTLGYEAGMVSWSSPWPSLTLQERGRVMLSALYAANIGRDRRHPGAPARPVVFITHSMGGLLTKKMLLLEREQRDRSGLADSTRGVVFLAVPHFGSDLAKGVRSESIRKLIQMHPAIEDLGADPSGRLKDLNDSFKQLGIDCFSVGEERAAPVALGLSAVVVKPDSADPGIGRFYVLPESDHMTICKAKSRKEPLYQDILQYVIRHAGA